jgi:hypothetical protein
MVVAPGASLRLSSVAPWKAEYIPVNKEAWDGKVQGALETMLVKRVPRAASPSMKGVVGRSYP